MRKSLMAWLLGLLVALSASPAAALTTGQCSPASEVRAALADEGMQPIIVGNRVGYVYTTSLIFFANADLSRGYLIRGDNPLGQTSDTACVDSVYRDIHLNDVAKPGVPAWALMPDADAKAATAICRRDHLGFQEKCGTHDVAITSLNDSNRRVMLAATGTAINPRDKSVRDDQLIVLSLQPAMQTGLITAATPEGANYVLSAYANGAYTQYGDTASGRGK